jgi:hypothetical protein
MLATRSVKQPIIGLKVITDLNRRMGPPGNKYHFMPMEATRFKWEIQMGGPPDNIIICNCKTHETGLKEITDLNRKKCHIIPTIAVSRRPHARGPLGNPTLLERSSEEEYRLQYREYVRKLETVAKDTTKRELSDMDLLEIFLQHENVHLYQDIETMMSVIVNKVLLISVDSESIVESWISTMEHHSSQRRTMVDGGDVAS